MRTDDLEYELPPHLIATEPPAERDAGRLLVVDRDTGALRHASIRQLADQVPHGSLLIVNDTRVIPARLRATKRTGGKAEFLLLRALDEAGSQWTALGRASNKLRPGDELHVAAGMAVHILERRSDGSFVLGIVGTDSPRSAIEAHGEVPLPPYMRRRPVAADRERYQTVFASRPGAVAAPTAGLHLSQRVLAELAARDVSLAALTLHVGVGTFSPVEAEDLDDHAMHSEYYEIPSATAAAVSQARSRGQPVVAVGTTVARALETWGLRAEVPLRGETTLLVQPGYSFRVVDCLLTNFHLPRSTLLALVMALAGVETTRAAYACAIENAYRFYSYGDAMLVRGRARPSDG